MSTIENSSALKLGVTPSQDMASPEWDSKFLSLSIDLLCIAGIDGRFRKVNPAFTRVLGYTVEELLSKPFISFLHPDDVSATLKEVEKLSTGQRTIKFQNRHITKGGDVCFIEWTVAPDTEAGLLFACGRDVTEKVSAENENKVLWQKLSQSSKMESLGKLSAGIAHEINNPLAVIYSWITLLPSLTNDPDRFQEKIKTMKSACQRIIKIVDGLKKFSRSNREMAFKTHSMSQIAKEVLLLAETKSKETMTPVSLEVTSDITVNCDEVAVGQVFLNLVNNGIDAVDGLENKWVKLKIFDEGHWVVVQIIDSGTGISKEVRDRMFDPFFTTKKIGAGTGLGLSISKGILDNHGGTIEVLSNSPNTCFEIRLPKAQTAKKAA